jgi:hypothetical protein
VRRINRKRPAGKPIAALGSGEKGPGGLVEAWHLGSEP